MRVSAYERVASLLLSVLIFMSVAVVLLFSVWLSSRFLGSQVAVPVVMEEVGTGEGSIGDSTEYDVPPGEAFDFEEPQVANTLAAVAEAVAAQEVVLADPSLANATKYGRGGRGGYGNNPYGSGGKPGRPRRWELEFPEGNTIESYAKQLDFFKIELGILLPDDKVAYAYNLSKPVPDRRTGSVDDEKRYYLTWRRGELEKVDRELLTRAGIDSQGRPVIKFLPREVEATLLQLERARAGNDAKSIRRTRFAIRAGGHGYTFEVLDQSYNFLQTGS
jgi:hypothetical protein